MNSLFQKPHHFLHHSWLVWRSMSLKLTNITNQLTKAEEMNILTWKTGKHNRNSVPKLSLKPYNSP